MASRIITKKGSGAPLASDLVHGELAVDTVNKRLYTEDAGGSIIELGTAPSTIDINSGTIDGTTIATSDITVGSGKTLDVSAGTLTLANDQISGDSIEGGTIGSVTITTADINGGTIDGATIGGASAAAGTFTTLTATGNVVLGNAATDTVTVTADVASDLIPSADGTYDLGASGAEWQDLFIDGTANIDSLVADTADINGGTIDGTVIGGSTPAAISGTTGNFSGNLTVDTNTLFVDAASNEVGIGTSSPRGILDINASDPQRVYIADNTDGVTLGHSVADSFVTLGSAQTGAVGLLNFNRATGVLTYSEGPVGSEVEYFRIAGNGDISFYEDTGTTPKFFWDASAESLGIGTSSPDAILDIVDTNLQVRLLRGSAFNATDVSTGRGLYLSSANNSTDSTGQILNAIVFSGQGTGRRRAMIANLQSGGSTTGGDIVFYNTPSSSAIDSVVERLRIDSSGNVGIGISSISRGELQINAASGATELHMTNTGTGTGSGDGFTLFMTEDGDGAGVWLREAEPLRFATSATERMRIDSSGNVGIGATPSSWNASFKALQMPAGSFWSFSNTAAGVHANAFNDAGWKYVNTAAATGYEQTAGTHQWFTAPSGTAGNAISFSERMRIDASGNLLVGGTATNPGQNNTTVGTAFLGAGRFMMNNSSSDNIMGRNSDGILLSIRRSGNEVGSISVTASATAYNTSSDYRLKEDVQPMVGASDRLMALKPVNFAWKVDGERVDGFLAHEAQEVVPEAVTGSKDAVDKDGKPEYQGIDQSKIVPLLTAALQEALQKIEALEARVAALEA